MLQCWEFDPTNRPAFSDLVNSLSHFLEAMADYMDIGAFGGIVISNPSASNPGAGDEPTDHDALEEEPSQSKLSGSQIIVENTCDETTL